MSQDPNAPPPPSVPAAPGGADYQYGEEHYQTHDAGSTAYHVPGMPTAVLDMEAETEDTVERQRRNQKMVAIGVAVGIHVIVGLLITLIVVSHYQKEAPEIIAISGEDVVADDLQKKTIQVTRQTPTASANKISRVIASDAVSNIPVPVVEDIVTDEPIEFGNLGDGRNH